MKQPQPFKIFSHKKPAPSGAGQSFGPALILWLLMACFFSCSRFQGRIFVMEGNFFNSRGLYTEAIASYLKARDYAESEPYAEYGLGSVYFALNEGAAALERFDSAEKAIRALNREDHGELIYRLRYNKGIIYFEEEKFKDAWEAFRNALETDGSRIEAKRNLELSLLAMEQERGVPPPVLRAGRGENETGTETLFDYLRRKEREQWENKNWPGESFPSGPDY